MPLVQAHPSQVFRGRRLQVGLLGVEPQSASAEDLSAVYVSARVARRARRRCGGLRGALECYGDPADGLSCDGHCSQLVEISLICDIVLLVSPIAHPS